MAGSSCIRSSKHNDTNVSLPWMGGGSSSSSWWRLRLSLVVIVFGTTTQLKNSVVVVNGFTTPTTTLLSSPALSLVSSGIIEQRQLTSSSSTSSILTTIQTKTTTTSTTRCWAKKPKKKKGGKKSSSMASSSSGSGFGGGSSSKSSDSLTSDGPPPSWSKTFPFAGSVRPGYLSPQKTVSRSIQQPDYAKTSVPKTGRPMLPWVVEAKTGDEIEKMRASGRLARKVLDAAGRSLEVGMTTNQIDELVHELTIAGGAYPSPLNYHGFPKSCCTSVNEVICHGIPDNRPLRKGDMINIDITVYLNGFHGDCSEMFVVGYDTETGRDRDDPELSLDDATKKLLQTTYDCWLKSLLFVKPGNFYRDIGEIIEDYVVPRGYSTVRNFCGHGVGSVFHTNPNILHYKNNEPNGEMGVGHTFTIEPMICEGSCKPLIWPDNWTATTMDGKRSAQFEHTLLITEDGVEALTGKTVDSPIQFWERESKLHKGIFLGTSQNAKKQQDLINEQNLLKVESSSSSSTTTA